ncbi:hypothetical protein IV102_16690 [bacterium]|nr:hypothetical protein [bacterium]
MAGSINGYNPNAVGVPVSKYISNATHSGALQDTGKKATQVKADPVVESKVEKPAAPPPPEAPPELPGLTVKPQADGGQQLAADSGVNLTIDKDGKINNIDVPGDGSIQRQSDGQMTMQTPNGQQIPVQPYDAPEGGFAGYRFTRDDQTQVHVDLRDMSVGYISQDGKVMQVLQADGSQEISCSRAFKDPKTGLERQLDTKVLIHPDGSVESGGYNRDLQVSAGKIQYKSPANFPLDIELPNRIAALAPPAQPAEPMKTAATAAPQGPLLMEESGPKPFINVVLPNQVGFSRDETGQTKIMLRSGLTLLHTSDATVVRDPKITDRLLPAEVENFKSADGRIEKAFKFKDADGNQFRMFNDSMDFLVDSPDGRVRQHILPGGTILGQIQGGDGNYYRFEVTPQGEVKTDRGLQIPPGALDKSIAYIPGPDGKPVGVGLPYPIPNDQANAGYTPNIYGSYDYPTSGQRLDAFQSGQAPPPQPGPTPPPNQGPTPPYTQGPAPMGMPPQNGGYSPTVLPYQGFPQQPVEPGFMQRLKYMFTGNPSDIQPRQYFSPPPPWMGAYPGSSNAPYSGIYDPSMVVPQSPMGSYYDQDPMAANTQPGVPGQPGYPPPQGPGGPGQPPIGSVPGAPSYPGQTPSGPNFAGQTPGYPGQIPDAGAYLNQMKAELDRNSQLMWGQLAVSQAGTQAMIMGQSMNSMRMNLSLGLAMWPTSMFFCPFRF